MAGTTYHCAQLDDAHATQKHVLSIDATIRTVLGYCAMLFITHFLIIEVVCGTVSVEVGEQWLENGHDLAQMSQLTMRQGPHLSLAALLQNLVKCPLHHAGHDTLPDFST